MVNILITLPSAAFQIQTSPASGFSLPAPWVPATTYFPSAL
jgi:hypothetical protein